MWPASPDRGGALHGVKVVDLTRVLAGPLCTQFLSDHGADVIKVEPPTGDETRQLGPPFDSRGEAAYYGSLNRGKRGIALDMGQQAARDVLHRLLADADVLVENFLPGTMERWGLGFEDVLSKQYPRLVYCNISGFGPDGPLGRLPGYDAVLQAMCGLMSVNGDAASGPTRLGVPMVDHLTGYVALSSILMALHARHRTGTGQRVEASLFDTAISMLLPHAANWMASGKTPGLLGSAHPNIAPYDKYQAADGWVFIGILNDGQFRRFCAHIGQADLATDERYATNPQRVINRQALRARIEPALAMQPVAVLSDGLMRIGVPAGPVNDVAQAIGQPHAQHRQMVIERGAYRGIRSPAVMHGTPAQAGDAPPLFAQHTTDILRGLGLNEQEIEALVSTGAAPSQR